jgi:hypothetical protein
MTMKPLTIVKYVGKVYKMVNRIVISVPRDFHYDADPLIGKQVKVEVTEAIL